jgi:hypothetical protein
VPVFEQVLAARAAADGGLAAPTAHLRGQHAMWRRT